MTPDGADRSAEQRGVRRALSLASEGVAAPDGLAETTWMRGRRVRRRRATLSGVAAATATGAAVLGWALLGPGGLPGGPDVIPAGAPDRADGSGGTSASALVETAPEPAQEEPGAVPVDASAETQRVWGVLRSACLQTRGYEVTVTGSTLTATQRGAQTGDYTRDTSLCDAELVMRLPPVEIAFVDGDLAPAADAALRAVYDDYVATAGCARAEGLPVDEAPAADEFVDLFAREWMPSWHPWTAAAQDGSYAQVRSACPVGAS